MKRFISCILCASMVTAAATVMAASDDEITFSKITFDEAEWSTTSFQEKVSLTNDDGVAVTITQPTPGSVTDSGFVVDNPTGNKYLQFKNISSTNVQPTFYIKPAAPLTEDFAVEFDYAADGLGYARAFRVVAYPVHADGVQTSATGNKFLEVNTANSTTTNCMVPISGTDTKKGTYPRDKKFQHVRIVTKFADTGNPTFDVYLDGTAAATDIPYTSYNGNGIAELRFEMNVSTTYVEQLAFDNIEIAKPVSINLPGYYSDGMVIPEDQAFVVKGDGLKAGTTVYSEIVSGTETVLETSAVVQADSSFQCSFSDTTSLVSGAEYKLKVRSGQAEKVIENVTYGKLLGFEGQTITAVCNNKENARIYVCTDGLEGEWLVGNDISGYDFECEVLNNLSGSYAGVVNFDEFDAFEIYKTICGSNITDEYLTASQTPVVFTGVASLTGSNYLDEIALNELEKKHYDKAIKVTAFDVSGAETALRVAQAIEGTYNRFIPWDINISGNKVYLVVSNDVDSVTASDFVATDINGNTYVGTSAQVDGNVVIIIFEGAETIIKLEYKEITDYLLDEEWNALVPFVSEFAAKETYDFTKAYDRDKFVDVYTSVDSTVTKQSDSIEVSGSSEFGIERKNLYYSAQNMTFTLKTEGVGAVEVLFGETSVYTGSLGTDIELQIDERTDGIYVNDVISSITDTEVSNIKVLFSGCTLAEITELEISMPEYSEILTLIVDVNALPDEAVYSAKDEIKRVYDNYVDLGGANNSYLTQEQKTKMASLYESYQEFIAAEQNPKANLNFTNNVPQTFDGGAITQLTFNASNINSRVPFDVQLVAVVYSSDGRMIGLDTDSAVVAPSSSEELNVDVDLRSVEAGRVSLFMLNKLSKGYLLFNDMGNEINN